MEISKCGSTLNQSSGNNLKMKELIKAINEYLKIKTENTAFVIKKFLQVNNSVSILYANIEYSNVILLPSGI